MAFFNRGSGLVRKIVFLPILIIVLSIIVIALIFAFCMSKETMKTATYDAESTLNVSIRTFDNYITSTSRLAEIFSNSFEAQGGDIDSLLLNLKKAVLSSDIYKDAFVSTYSGNARDINNHEFFISKSTNDSLRKGEKIAKIVKSEEWEDSGFPVLRIGVPINIYGNFQGGVFFDIPIAGENSKIFRLITASKIGKYGYGFLLTQTGTVLVHENSDYIWKNIKDIKAVEFKVPIANRLPDFLNYKMFGKKKFAVGKTDPITNTKFYLAVCTQNIMGDVKMAIFFLFVAFFLVAVFLALILYSQIKPVVGDILQVNSALKDISKGNYDVVLKTESHTEVDEIAKNTIFMAKEIKNDLYEIEYLKSYMENILNSLNVAIVTADRKGKLEFSNDYAKKIFNLEGVSLIFDFIVKNNLNIYFDPDKLLESNDFIYFPDVEFKEATFDVYIRSYKSIVAENILIAAYDISKRKDLENTLSQIQRMQSLGLMASGIAHDFNNFLGTIQGYLELMQISSDSAQRNSYVTKAYDSIYDAKNMVNKLLVFTKSSIQNREVLNLSDIINTAIEMVRNSIGLKNIFFDFSGSNSDIKIEMDKTDALQIFTNLFLNSIQAIDRVGKITIKAKTLYIESDRDSLRAGKYVKIIVNDNGSGIPEKDINKVFDPFFTTKNEGTGLGMYVIRTIVEKNSGSIKLLSKEGIGTTVEILLPLYSGSIQPKKTNSENYYYGNGETLLLVDDDDNMRGVVKEMLFKLNYKVYDFADPDEGLKFLKERNDEISLIILDILMPKRDAYGFLDAMLEYKIDVPVLLISGFTTKFPKIEKYPFYKAFLPKPFGMKTLSLMVARYLKRRL